MYINKFKINVRLVKRMFYNNIEYTSSFYMLHFLFKIFKIEELLRAYLKVAAKFCQWKLIVISFPYGH